MLDIMSTDSPEHVINLVREAETDPAGERWPRGKVHDDATTAYCKPSPASCRFLS